MATPSFTLLTPSGDAIVDALTNGTRWDTSFEATIYWSISDGFSAEFWISPADIVAGVGEALDVFAYYANLHFQYVGYFQNPIYAASGGSDINVSVDGAGLFFNSPTSWARGSFPSALFETAYVGQSGDIYLNLNSPANSLPSYALGSQGWFLVLHELGHTLGLKHTHDDGGTGRPTLQDIGLPAFDQDWASVMSYNDQFAGDLLHYDPATPMILDVLALQALYGVNRSAGLGDTIYSLGAQPYYYTIWDAGGWDVLDASNSSFGWEIALPDYQLSDVVTEKVGYAVSEGSAGFEAPTALAWLEGDIEAVSGSEYRDAIGGNAVDNVLFGNGGDDILSSGAGQDTIDGGGGVDTVFYATSRASLEFTSAGPGAFSVSKPGATDSLSAIEVLRVEDGALLFDLAGDNVEFVYRIYAAAYGRTPDEGGLRFWTGVMDGRGPGAPDAGDQEYLASFFLTANEFINLYGSNPTDYQYIDAMYANVLNRVPDQGGYDFWVGAMQGGLGRDDILISFAESAENVAQTAPDLDNGIWVL
jgi:serralysin